MPPVVIVESVARTVIVDSTTKTVIPTESNQTEFIRFVTFTSGPPGPPGRGLAPGGVPGQVLGKTGIPDYQTGWINVAGVTPSSYRHVQSTASAVWTVVHNLGYRPGGIFVEDTAHTQWEPRIRHVDANSLTLSFFINNIPAPMSGEADIS